MRRIGSCLSLCVLLAVPALAQSSKTFCGAKVSPSLQGFGLDGAYRPLAPGQRLFFGLAGLEPDAALEVRYLVDGKPYLTEIVDLAAARPPQADVAGERATLDLKTALETERMIELLALRPDLVKQLQERAEKNASIRIEVHQKGRQVEGLSFQELRQRSADLGGRAVPLVVRSTVSGPGSRTGDTMKSAVAFNYLPDCGDCTWETPCETSCGYDPGKGGPVTCGEYGAPCDSGTPCSCSTVYPEYWTDWYIYNAYYSSQYACFEDTNEDGFWHQAYIYQTRRDRIRPTLVCPNCPACSDCYFQYDVVNYQLGSGGCWSNTYSICFWGDPLCCSEPTCSFNSACHWNC